MILNEDRSRIRDVARRFARERLLPAYQKREATACVEREVIEEMAALGLIAPELPEELGGLGLPSVTVASSPRKSAMATSMSPMSRFSAR